MNKYLVIVYGMEYIIEAEDFGEAQQAVKYPEEVINIIKLQSNIVEG